MILLYIVAGIIGYGVCGLLTLALMARFVLDPNSHSSEDIALVFTLVAGIIMGGQYLGVRVVALASPTPPSSAYLTALEELK